MDVVLLWAVVWAVDAKRSRVFVKHERYTPRFYYYLLFLRMRSFVVVGRERGRVGRVERGLIKDLRI